MGRWDRAISDYQKVLSTLENGARSQGEIHLRIGEAQRRKGDANAAIQSLQAARQTLPDDARVLSTLGLALDGAQRWPEAKQIYEAALKLDPNNGVVLNNLAFGLAENNGDLDQALTLAQRAKQLIPNMPEVSDTLGWIYLKKNLPDNAIDIFRDLVVRNPDQATYRYHLGMAYAQKGDKAKAIPALTRALELNPAQAERRTIEELVGRLR
jgi:Flp pilus assembly protein TadD